jgi:hypothetical protein
MDLVPTFMQHYALRPEFPDGLEVGIARSAVSGILRGPIIVTLLFKVLSHGIYSCSIKPACRISSANSIRPMGMRMTTPALVFERERRAAEIDSVRNLIRISIKGRRLRTRRPTINAPAIILLFLLLQGASLLFAQSSKTWSFAVSGDSRNCGDIVMGGIAEGVRASGAKFYWHLGDFRAMYDFDEDMLSAPEYRNRHLSISDYQRIAWQDFISQQIEPFGTLPVHLTIGNHELVAPKTRADFVLQFADWLDTSELRAQRLRDDPRDHKLHIYNHWIETGVDFISVDNASPDQFDNEQLAWIERVLARDAEDTSIRSIVVGMHDALPDSISTGHGMNESAQMERSGRRVYRDLLDFRNKNKKPVYVLASHSHFLIEDVYNDACHPGPDTLLPGWIVGTAGAVRYRLPSNLEGAKQRKTDVYGFLLGTVQLTGEIQFSFTEVKQGDLPGSVRERYGSKQVQACFEENKSPYEPAGPNCPIGMPSGN